MSKSSDEFEAPTTALEWARRLADGIRALLADTSKGLAKRTLRAFEEWDAGQEDGGK